MAYRMATRDTAHKEAFEQLAQKRGFIKNRVEDEKVPDFATRFHFMPVALISCDRTIKSRLEYIFPIPAAFLDFRFSAWL